MDKVLLIEASGMAFRCDPVSPTIKESTDKTGMMILKGVPATILDRENGNGRGILDKKCKRPYVKPVRPDYSRTVVSSVLLMIIRKNHFWLQSIFRMLLLMLTLKRLVMILFL